MGITEITYGGISRLILSMVNPFKRVIMVTECRVHQRINLQAIEILKNDGYMKEHEFFMGHIRALNAGVIWADQDFKSIHHFYNPYRKKGMYGQSNALVLAREYYHKAEVYHRRRDIDKAVFYLGAAVHLVQDVTIPQHANIRLLQHHKKYETFVKRLYENSRKLKAVRGIIEFDEIGTYVRFNARTALHMYKRFKDIEDKGSRFFRTARCSLPLAERTTAGCLIMFYRDHFSEEKRE